MQDDTSQKVTKQTGPVESESKKAHKHIPPVNQIQKEIIKPGPEEKRFPKHGPNTANKNLRGKAKVSEPSIASESQKNIAVAPKSSLSEEDREKRRQMDEEILADMRRRNQVDLDKFEASKISKNFLDSFVVRNAYLTQNPPFREGNGGECRSDAGARSEAPLGRPPNPSSKVLIHVQNTSKSVSFD
ncbi:hypothetical protein PIB30_083028 [Stylosanthes scabra]|uniref:Uncharacterized protein n=1 Tax=Stylosanthes scabra TaxID=79078 RepID=A0ABU6RSJ5_9FABA|nr:hypothetical protein [Stylosanthes scabra]